MTDRGKTRPLRLGFSFADSRRDPPPSNGSNLK